ncbi:MAG TPA: helix-turn-helix domain-containing protein [Microthrixaceae bacterium]|nr:helix-turn-helix domain-containing protein [Microthrixaceae bacterium]
MGGTRSGSADAILGAAQLLIRERGPEKLRLAAVAEAAGVSRQTLYRWFPTKDDLLAAISQSEQSLFDDRLHLALESVRQPVRRLDIALRTLVTYLDENLSTDVIGVDPGFALASLAAALEPQAESLVTVLGEAFDEIPAVASRAITRQEAADLLLRLAYSHYLLPHPDPERLLVEIRAFAGLPRRRSRRPAG